VLVLQQAPSPVGFTEMVKFARALVLGITLMLMKYGVPAAPLKLAVLSVPVLPPTTHARASALLLIGHVVPMAIPVARSVGVAGVHTTWNPPLVAGVNAYHTFSVFSVPQVPPRAKPVAPLTVPDWGTPCVRTIAPPQSSLNGTGAGGQGVGAQVVPVPWNTRGDPQLETKVAAQVPASGSQQAPEGGQGLGEQDTPTP
jgi:hypothetical protein